MVMLSSFDDPEWGSGRFEEEEQWGALCINEAQGVASPPEELYGPPPATLPIVDAAAITGLTSEGALDALPEDEPLAAERQVKRRRLASKQPAHATLGAFTREPAAAEVEAVAAEGPVDGEGLDSFEDIWECAPDTFWWKTAYKWPRMDHRSRYRLIWRRFSYWLQVVQKNKRAKLRGSDTMSMNAWWCSWRNTAACRSKW